MSELNPEVIEHALAVARKHGFAEIELESGTSAFRAKLDPAAKAKRRNHETEATEPSEPAPKPIRSPLVGYYSTAPRGLKVGQVVKAGDFVATVTALGINNEVEASVNGEVIEVLVADGDPVEYGQTLALVKES